MAAGVLERGPTERMQMEETQMEVVPAQIQAGTQPAWPRLVALAAEQFTKVWRVVVRRAGSKRKTLSVRETAALGDRRFVSVIQFERQRFLVGSSSSSITLLAQLPDDSNGGSEAGERS
jgi:hypothetical protein